MYTRNDQRRCRSAFAFTLSIHDATIQERCRPTKHPAGLTHLVVVRPLNEARRHRQIVHNARQIDGRLGIDVGVRAAQNGRNWFCVHNSKRQKTISAISTIASVRDNRNSGCNFRSGPSDIADSQPAAKILTHNGQMHRDADGRRRAHLALVDARVAHADVAQLRRCGVLVDA